MKYLEKVVFVAALLILTFFDIAVFAKAYLEGEEPTQAPSSVFDGLDASLIMAKWYKIVLIFVGVLCVAGLIISNIVYYVKKKRNNK